MAVLSLTTAPTHGADLVAHDSLDLVAGVGIEQDRHAGKRRQVTIVCTGELALAATELGVDALDAVATRRNIAIDAPTLPRRHGERFTIGAVEFEVWRDCAPCELMDDAFGPGAKEALRDRCGISASVVVGGTIAVGDAAVFASSAD